MILKCGTSICDVLCDNCLDGFQADSRPEAMQKMTDEGWWIYRGEHYCPECVEAMRNG